jgi:hypothetical protein
VVGAPKTEEAQRLSEPPLGDKETLHWVKAIEEAASALAAVGAKAWYQIDREGDRFWTLKALRDSGGWFSSKPRESVWVIFTVASAPPVSGGDRMTAFAT